MFASRTSRIVLISSLAVGIVCVFAIPPYLYFQFDRFVAGLPQQYPGFDPDRYLAGAPQRSGLTIAGITAAKFAVGVLVVWLFYGVAHFIRSGRPSSSSSPL